LARGSTQSVSRALALLRAVAAAGRDGRRLTQLADSCGLNKSTTHRLMESLCEAGLVEHDSAAKLFLPGIELFLLGNAAAVRFSIVEIARPSLIHLAEETGDTVFLTVSVANEWLCVERQIGAFPIRTLTVDVGDRGPLGVGSGGLALLAFRDDAEVDASIGVNRGELASYRDFNPASLRQLVATTRRQGYAFIDGLLVEGMSAIGMPICDPRGHPVAALSVAAISSRMGATRRRTIVPLLRDHARRIEKQLGVLAGATVVTARSRKAESNGRG
jgi:DNA-binding IclR family transcriptional regulator